MRNISETYRGCHIYIKVAELPATWGVVLSVLPLAGTELIRPIGDKTMKLPKEESIDLIASELLGEARLAIDLRIVDPAETQ